MTLRSKCILLLALMAVSAGIATWFYHGHQIEQGKANAAAAEKERARTIVAKVKSTWNADDGWEDVFSSPSSSLTPYTINVQQALIKGRPLIFFGTVDDVRSSGEQGSSIVLIRCEGRTDKLRMGLLRLRLSLLSTPEVTDALLRNKPRLFETYVFAATVTGVEKVAMPPDKDDNDQDYFLAHGTLQEAQPIDTFFIPNK